MEEGGLRKRKKNMLPHDFDRLVLSGVGHGALRPCYKLSREQELEGCSSVARLLWCLLTLAASGVLER